MEVEELRKKIGELIKKHYIDNGFTVNNIFYAKLSEDDAYDYECGGIYIVDIAEPYSHGLFVDTGKVFNYFYFGMGIYVATEYPNRYRVAPTSNRKIIL